MPRAIDHPLSERAYVTTVFKASPLYRIDGDTHVVQGRRHGQVAASFYLSQSFRLKRLVDRLASPLFEKRIRGMEMSPRVGVVLAEVSGVVKVRHHLVRHCWNREENDGKSHRPYGPSMKFH